jgi:hypothetical protein
MSDELALMAGAAIVALVNLLPMIWANASRRASQSNKEERHVF